MNRKQDNNVQFSAAGRPEFVVMSSSAQGVGAAQLAALRSGYKLVQNQSTGAVPRPVPPLTYTNRMIVSIFALVLSSAAAMPQASANPVYRCHGTHGETVFSGIPCDARSDLRPESGYANDFDSTDGWGGHCPDSAQGLSDRVAAVFDSGKVNDLGALFLWSGYGTRTAYRHLNALQTMLKKPLAGLTLIPSQASTWFDNGPAGPSVPELLQVEVAVPGMGDTRETWRFPVVERDACFWLEYSPMQETSFP